VNGTLETVWLDSPALAGNPLGDPARRELLVYLPPGYEAGRERFPAVYFLHGFGSGVRAWTGFSGFAPTTPERLDALIAASAVPPCLGVFADGWTALGGTQWIDSDAVGRYGQYVARDLVGFVDSSFRTVSHRLARAVVGKSSGGYGALALGAFHAEVFGHLGAHSADAYFEYCYLPELPKAAAALLAHADAGAWFAAALRRAAETKLEGKDFAVVNVLAMAAHYSPRRGAPLGLDLPFEAETGRIREEVWARWLEHDPVRFVPRRAAAVRSLASVWIDCGTRDEFHLRWGARMVARELDRLGVEHVHEEFEDGHLGTGYRYAPSLAWLLPRLARR
jgi:S-formylglutathione hydrolase FrmB